MSEVDTNIAEMQCPADRVAGAARQSLRSERPAMSRPVAVARWLWLLWFLVWAMVVVGGLTRLTGSGLSMVEWHPLMGVWPPLTAEDWLAVFARYQQSPQYELVNHWMSVEDFKRIFLWEYGHRLLGRLIGVAFALPYAFFLIRKRIVGRDRLRVGLAFLAGGGQGLLGWYMVKSGLVAQPAVSHFRLAAHLSLAFAVGMYLLWLALNFGEPRDPLFAASRRDGSRALRIGAYALVLVLAMQIVYGAFMAGTHAGLLFSTFPDMNGHWLPGAFFRFSSLSADLSSNPMAIHWMHRALGWSVAAIVVALAWAILRRSGRDADLRGPVAWLALLTAVQIALGAWTVVQGVALVPAAAHQACAYLLCSSAFWLLYRMRHPLIVNTGAAEGGEPSRKG